MADKLAQVTATAVTPDQLVDYVAAVSGLESGMAGSCLLHRGGGQAVLVAYPVGNPCDSRLAEEAVAKVCALSGIEHLAVLGAARPANCPPEAESRTDWYWQIPLPCPKPGQKLRNMLKRAAREVIIHSASGPNAYGVEHAKLAEEFCAAKQSLDEGSRYLFGRLGAYVAKADGALLFSARRKTDNSLCGFAIGDFTPLATCFYMFACRSKTAPPGTADLLLEALVREGEARGHARVNLGLGIDPGVEFFKKKWGAKKFLPFVETDWEIRRKGGFFARLFGKRHGK